jgi:hypothetical protein
MVMLPLLPPKQVTFIKAVPAISFAGWVMVIMAMLLISMSSAVKLAEKGESMSLYNLAQTK